MFNYDPRRNMADESQSESYRYTKQHMALTLYQRAIAVRCNAAHMFFAKYRPKKNVVCEYTLYAIETLCPTCITIYDHIHHLDSEYIVYTYKYICEFILTPRHRTQKRTNNNSARRDIIALNVFMCAGCAMTKLIEIKYQ